MKRLFVLRHAKSDWDSGAGSDHERPLNARGEKAADRVGGLLAAIGPPDRILRSSALRVVDTVDRAASAGGWEVPTETLRELYGISPAGLLRVLGQQQAGLDRVLVAGHEPTLSQFIGELVGQARVRFPTAALARIDLPVTHWSQIAFGLGELRFLVTPKLLRRAASV